MISMVIGFLKLHVSLTAWHFTVCLQKQFRVLYPVRYFTGTFDVTFCIMISVLF